MSNKSEKKFEQEGGAAVEAGLEGIQYIITDEDLYELTQRLNMEELRQVLEVVKVDESAFKRKMDEIEGRQYDGEDYGRVRQEREQGLTQAAYDSIYINFDDLDDTPEAPDTVSNSARQELREALRNSDELGQDFADSLVAELQGKQRITDIREIQKERARRFWLSIEDGPQTPDVMNPVYEGEFDLRTILLYKHLPRETYLLSAIGVDVPALINAVERFRVDRTDVDPKLTVGLCEKLYQGVASRMLHRMVIGDSFTEDNLDRFVRMQMDIVQVYTDGSRKCMDRQEVYEHLGMLLMHMDKKTSAQIAGTDELYMKFVDSEEFWDLVM